MGLFKPKACDWCDDIAGETADLSCGDAWLPEFEHDSGGTNIVVVRSAGLLELIQEGIRQESLDLKTQPVKKVYQSQAGNFRHRQEGLSVRVQSAKQLGVWFPKKRVDEATFTVSHQRQKIYMLRSQIAQFSHKAFKQAKEKNSFLFFILRLLPFEMKYQRLNGRLFKGLAKSGYQIFRFIVRRCE